jgi:hypothetical protein
VDLSRRLMMVADAIDAVIVVGGAGVVYPSSEAASEADAYSLRAVSNEDTALRYSNFRNCPGCVVGMVQFNLTVLSVS